MVKLGEILALVAVVIILVAALAVYAGVTYPTTVVNNQVSFTIGADSKTTTFVQSFLNDKVKIQVTVQTGAALWRAQIKNGDQILWEHSAAQGKQQSYNSDWISLPSGNYNFTFGTIGVESLQASATVSSKGGFW